ncbi:MAG: UPF0176 protein [Acidimicrobiales bacterium]|jgi:UPF0176 protein
MKKDLRPRWEKKAAVAVDGIERMTFSFYKYVRIENPKKLQEELLERWGSLGCLGRIYVASEGINAQVNVPKKHWDQFDAYMKSKKEFASIPYKMAIEEGEESSFYKLIVRVKDKIVADGLDDDSFDVTNTGEYLTAKEMNEYVDDPEAVIVDMRNIYEAEVGHFEGAICPDVDTFREELKVTPETLRIHKNKKMALYCTGGIRCEKASAWLKHNGFENVKHLKGGIIDYKHQVEREGIENKFLGKNFVFDERMGEHIGNEIISTCHLCVKNKSDTHYHCKNQACHILFLGCGDCIEKKKGFCSNKCMTFDRLPVKVKRMFTRNHYKRKAGAFRKYRIKAKNKIGA